MIGTKVSSVGGLLQSRVLVFGFVWGASHAAIAGVILRVVKGPFQH